jgi:ribosomal protein S25
LHDLCTLGGKNLIWGEKEEMEEEIMKVLRKEDETVTPASIAWRLGADISVVEGCLRGMEKKGKLQTVTWEKLLRMGK